MTSFSPSATSSSVSEKDIYRIQVSLASMKTTVRVVPTYARVFVLEERFEVPQPGQTLPVTHRHEWKLVCTGIPCVLTDRQAPYPTSPFAVKVAVAEAESGLAIWDCMVEPSSDYRATLSNFHTFRSVTHSMYGIQFVGEPQAQAMFEFITELLSSELHLSRQAGALWYLEGESTEKDKEAKKPEVRHRSHSVSKKDISKPCNFVHLAGITSKRTETCEKELTGTMRRMKERSKSLNNLHSEEVHKPSPRISKKFSFRKSKRKSAKPASPQVGTPFAAQTTEVDITPSSAQQYSFFNRSRSSSDVPKGGLTRQPCSTSSLGFEPSFEPEIDTMFKKQLELGSKPVRASVPEYVLQTSSSFRPAASIGGSSKTVSRTEGPSAAGHRASAPQMPTFSTAVYARGFNPLPSKFAPMYSSATSLTSEGKPKRRQNSNRARVSISDSTSNLSSEAPSPDDDEEESPFLVERYAQQGPETSVEASLVPIMDPDEYCNEVGKRGRRATTGAYSYTRYSRNMAKQRETAQGMLRRPASSTSVNASPAVQPARPPSPSNSSHSSGSRKADSSSTYQSDSIAPRQSVTDTAQLVSQYTERMSEALQMFDNLVLTGLDCVGNPPSSATRLPPAEVTYGTLSSEV